MRNYKSVSCVPKSAYIIDGLPRSVLGNGETRYYSDSAYAVLGDEDNDFLLTDINIFLDSETGELFL